MLENIRKENKKRATVVSYICAVTALVLTTLFTGYLVRERGILVEVKAKQAQESLSKEVLRFHVLANSDSEEDQELKMQVKEAVLSYLKTNMPDSKESSERKSDKKSEESEIAETRAWVAAHLDEIEAVAAQTLEDAGSDDSVTAELENVMFPKKTYGDVTFPAGEYEALRIEIGDAKGQNWWCCLYPNLCFLDAVNAVVPDEGKQELEEVLDEECYEMVTAASDFKIKWFFFGGVK